MLVPRLLGPAVLHSRQVCALSPARSNSFDPLPSSPLPVSHLFCLSCKASWFAADFWVTHPVSGILVRKVWLK